MNSENEEPISGALYLDDLVALDEKQICKYYTMSAIILRSTPNRESCRQLVSCIYGLCSKLGEYADDLLNAYEQDISQAALIEMIHTAEDGATVLDALKQIQLASSREMQAIVFFGVITYRYRNSPGIEERLSITAE